MAIKTSRHENVKNATFHKEAVEKSNAYAHCGNADMESYGDTEICKVAYGMVKMRHGDRY